MPRVYTVQKARKPIPSSGVAIGDRYYWWKFRRGGKRISKIYPRRSQLTQSWFYQAMYDLEDDVSRAISDFGGGLLGYEDLASALEDAASTVRETGEECQGNLENMPEQLQDSDSGQTLQSRVESCETIADALEGTAQEIRDMEPEESATGEEKDEALENARDHADNNISWEYD